MKYLLIVCSVLSIFSYADEKEETVKQEIVSNRLGYLRFGIAEIQDTIGANGGYGNRYQKNGNAIDFYIGSVYTIDKENVSVFVSFPRISYLRYFSPYSSSSFFAGLGINYGSILHIKKYQEDRWFIGLLSTFSFGFELNRHGNCKNFLQIDYSSPLVALVQKGKKPHSVLELAYGISF